MNKNVKILIISLSVIVLYILAFTLAIGGDEKKILHENVSKSQQNKPKMTMDAIADRLTLEFAQKMQFKYDFEMRGMGGGGDGGLNLLSVHFRSKKSMEVLEVREIYISAIQEFLNMINQCQELRPYLKVYPFTFENVDIMLSFYDDEYKRPARNFVSLVFFSRGDLIFESKGQGFEPFETLCREPLEEAVKKVSKQEENGL